MTEDDLLALMDTVNSVRPKLWQTRGADLLGEVAFLDADGTIVPPTGVSASRAWASPTKAFEDYPYGTGTSRRNSPYGVIRRPSSVNSNLACDPGPVSLSLVVRGGTVYDGIGAPGVSCDVLIEGDWVV